MPEDSSMRIDQLQVPLDALALIPRAMAERYRVCPLGFTEVRSGTPALAVATIDPSNLMLLDQIQQLTNYRIHPVRATEQAILNAITAHYDSQHVAAPTDLLQQDGSVSMGSVNDDTESGYDQNGSARGVPEKVNAILQHAINARASDIHIEPHPKTVYVRFRIDGILYDHMNYPPNEHAPIVSRIKVLAKLDISQNRLPQDGRLSEVNFGNRVFDVRVSIMPSTSGEKVVMRLLPKGTLAMDFAQLGLTGANRAYVDELIAKPFGMLLVTGPTGSGKTTTLYASLAKIDSVSKNVVTVEDPVEYQFPRITQVQVHPKIGLTFASGLRAFLRQDPDIIMVGEIRDLETLQISIQAALTGHLVLSTLHCNDAAAAAARMLDMGAEPFLVASSVSGIVAQRLVRKICPQCRITAPVSEVTLQKLGLQNDGTPFYIGKGCQACRGTGYAGRIGVFEVLMLTGAVQQAVMRKANATEIRSLMRQHGDRSLFDDGLEKARAGITTLEEVMRAVHVDVI